MILRRVACAKFAYSVLNDADRGLHHIYRDFLEAAEAGVLQRVGGVIKRIFDFCVKYVLIPLVGAVKSGQTDISSLAGY